MKGAVLALGILGAVFGLIGAVFALGLGSLGNSFGSQELASISKNGLVALVASIVGLVGAVLVFSKPRLAGWLMIGAGVVGFVVAFLAYIIGAIFFVVAGIMALTLKEKAADVASG